MPVPIHLLSVVDRSDVYILLAFHAQKILPFFCPVVPGMEGTFPHLPSALPFLGHSPPFLDLRTCAALPVLVAWAAEQVDKTGLRSWCRNSRHLLWRGWRMPNNIFTWMRTCHLLHTCTAPPSSNAVTRYPIPQNFKYLPPAKRLPSTNQLHNKHILLTTVYALHFV